MLKNMARILEKPVFRGWYPLRNPLRVQGSVTELQYD